MFRCSGFVKKAAKRLEFYNFAAPLLSVSINSFFVVVSYHLTTFDYIYISIYLSIYLSIYIYIYIYIYLYIYIYICMYIRVCVGSVTYNMHI